MIFKSRGYRSRTTKYLKAKSSSYEIALCIAANKFEGELMKKLILSLICLSTFSAMADLQEKCLNSALVAGVHVFSRTDAGKFYFQRLSTHNQTLNTENPVRSYETDTQKLINLFTR